MGIKRCSFCGSKKEKKMKIKKEALEEKRLLEFDLTNAFQDLRHDLDVLLRNYPYLNYAKIEVFDTGYTVIIERK